MVHRTVQRIEELRAERQPEEERVTIQNLVAIHVLHIIVQEQNDRLI